MERMRNPFRATFGTTPPLLVGRDVLIKDFGFALDNGPGTHERTSLIIGARGIGKTVLLNAFEDCAEQRGWRIIDETATPGFVDRIRDRIIKILASDKKTLTGLNLTIFNLGLGLNWETRALHETTYTLRDAIEDLLVYQHSIDKKMKQEPTGLLITLDEIHHLRRDEVFDFSATIQHIMRREGEIAVAMAGIPSAIRPLLASDNDANPVTFLRRANRIVLEKVSDAEVRVALNDPVKELGVEWDQTALKYAVKACAGYPFMIQLVGQAAFHMRENQSISVEAAEQSIQRARRKLGQLVHEPALSDLSYTDRAFLACMAQDDGPSQLTDIAQRLGKTAQYISNYRRRLINAEMITPTANKGEIDFSLPYLRDYLREYAVDL
ncbi:ATP-binding protein [Corynebacterium sp. sy017]|uniref:ATP-binding protein n=1 Tax=unclassified Corynebacterium TaxID=2624378 RepID=UPI001185A2D5|nr:MULTISPECIES: ATP-binding protein [unclassified Corynebacterium]MBP3089268.1 ATP-binding protein [Corynebacterium sp. sy017]TSD91027.1 ATP-binding protein [Corynebacterium sp. SY003]